MAAGLGERAAELGVLTEYFDARGVRHTVPTQTVAHLVAALAEDVATKGLGAAQSFGTWVWRKGRTRELSLPVGSRIFAWRLLEGEREIARGRGTGGRLVLDDHVPLGAYTLRIERRGTPAFSGSLVVAPQTAYQMDDRDAERVWVLAVQLYAVRSRRNWGHGDFTDLKALVRLAGAMGAAGVGLNPLHALFDDRAEQASPYAPNSRLFLNPLYIDVEAIPEFDGAEALGLTREIERLRQTEEVDYAAVAAVKNDALRSAYARFRERGDSARREDFEAFRHERGTQLTRFAAFETLRRKFWNVWWEWPAEWRRPDDAAIAALRAEHGAEMGFYEFVQWIADRQLGACQDEARKLGLPVGLYVDLAVGVEPGGADGWGRQDSIVGQVEVGAPPDLLNTAGQAWGVATFNPRALEATAFAAFADVLDAAMRHAGAIRLDHVLGLNRLFLIPLGSKAADGAYVRFPLEGLLAVVALESMRRRCLVIGEDLGTVPEELRGILADWGIWSYLVLLFERAGSGAFLPPQDYRRNALATFGTHDLSTFPGWRERHDLRVKRALGLDPGETDEERERAHWMLGEVLAKCGVCVDRPWDYRDIARFLARTQSRLVAVSIEDVLDVLDQPNVPGTMDEHPNWRRRLPVALEDLAGDDRLRAVAAIMAEEGRAARS